MEFHLTNSCDACTQLFLNSALHFETAKFPPNLNHRSVTPFSFYSFKQTKPGTRPMSFLCALNASILLLPLFTGVFSLCSMYFMGIVYRIIAEFLTKLYCIANHLLTCLHHCVLLLHG